MSDLNETSEMLVANDSLEVYPWQKAAWNKLIQYKQSGKMPHALLLSGKKGLAKAELGMLWAKSLLCEQIDKSVLKNSAVACNQCVSCQLFNAETHPDFKLVQPEELGKAIKVDQIRELVDFVSLTRTRGTIRVIIVNPAEAMNTNAANSLLKTLEEPPENTLLILVSSEPQFLPATIRSRCQQFPLSVSDMGQLHDWLMKTSKNTDYEVSFALNLAENAPLLGLSYLDSEIVKLSDDLLKDWQMLAQGALKPTNVAEKWLKQPENVPIKLVYTWLVDMIRYHSLQGSIMEQADVDQTQLLYYKDNEILKDLALSIPIKRLFGIYDKVIDMIKFGHTSLNKQLQFESLLIQWSLIAQQK